MLDIPFVQVDIDSEIEKNCKESPSFAKAWNENKEEYKLIGEMISLRKAEKITQSQAAVITGSKHRLFHGLRKSERHKYKTYILNLAERGVII